MKNAQEKSRIMEDLKFYLEYAPPFLGNSKNILEADYAILGVPFDFTSTYRPGARFAPNAIREASANLETYNPVTGVDCEESRITDLGNLTISNDAEETLNRLSKVSSYIGELQKTQITIGGEHTITKGCASRLTTKRGKLLCFDAHLDLRDEFLNTNLSHTTFMRRVIEEIGPEKVTYIGARALTRDELEYTRKHGVKVISSETFNNLNVEILETLIRKNLDGDPAYVSIDMDAVDPSFAPAVGNPEPNGVDPLKLTNILTRICMRNEILGFDLVEVSPRYDTGATAALAAKIIIEVTTALDSKRISSTWL